MMLYDDRVKKKALDHIERFGPAPTHIEMARLAGQNKKILELGCATGYVSRLLAEKGCRVTGVELDADAAMQARRFCQEVLEIDLSQPGALDAIEPGYDCIICGDILEHLPDPESVLVSCRRLLAENGFLLVSIPNIGYWKMRWKLLMGRFEYEDTGLLDHTHLRFYTVLSFQRMVRTCGYKIECTVVNDAGFPGSRLISRLPGLKRVIRRLELICAAIRPNLFVFHAIYKLVPVEPGDTTGSSL